MDVVGVEDVDVVTEKQGQLLEAFILMFFLQ